MLPLSPMKTAVLCTILSVAILTSTPTVHSQPAKVWETRLAETVFTGINLAGSGADGSIVVRGGSGATNRVFWINRDGALIAELTASWDSAGQVVFVSSEHVLTRNWLFLDAAGTGRLTHFSMANGLLATSTYDLPGRATSESSEYKGYAYAGPLAFYTMGIINGATYLTKWRFEGLEPTGATQMSLRRASQDKLMLSATSPSSTTIDSSDDLKAWRALTNFTGQIELPIDPKQQPKEFFRTR